MARRETGIREKIFETREDLFGELLADTTAQLSAAVQQRGRAAMLLSGGTSPGAFYGALSHAQLNWGRIWLGLSDERWVAPDHADSNEGLVRRTLLQNQARTAHFVGLKSPAGDVEAGQPLSERQLRTLPRPFDIVLLGMGADGHTASLFPDSPDLPAALDEGATALCRPIRRGPDETPRMTMTLAALLDAAEVKLLFFGPEKWQTYMKARKQKSALLPVSHILCQDRVPVTVYWAP